MILIWGKEPTRIFILNPGLQSGQAKQSGNQLAIVKMQDSCRGPNLGGRGFCGNFRHKACASTELYVCQCVCDKFHLTLSFKSKVSRDVFKNQNECQLTSTFSSKMSLQCHMPSNMCHFNLQSAN
jgi:hypothetical protein